MSSSPEQSGVAPEPTAIDKQTSSTPTPDKEVRHLLVEDNRINQIICLKAFKNLGLPCHTAENGKEAVDIYKADPERYRFILMDLSMPIMGGIAASREIREHEKEHGLQPAVIVALLVSSTGADDPNGEKAKVEGGMNAMIEKPILSGPLKALLESYPI
ncbi:hypothetical protein CDV31_009997 [Fusarium ambrosium]|uniref:Response regulatory domain-containing protein n=1 Tax=Fusarium ambrosium TaxID=131363 RepID=A0A428TRI7_9HYPO|nr:hypothetical protein CDV31_009997 [Fusarium ambrosium]